jgi:hypothetical protein
MECWGAQGGSKTAAGNNGHCGLGAYTSGWVNLNGSISMYIYVGSAGETESHYSHDSSFGYNGGGSGQRGSFDINYYGTGGGATDIRLTNGSWDNFNSLKTRIIVAGAGGAISFGGSGGSGGTLKGEDGIPNDSVPTTADQGVDRHGYGGTQISGGKAGSFKWAHEPPTDGTFGQGGDGNSDYGGGGGGGYYGGGGSGVSLGARGGAGGGSSFISGHAGCNAISSSSTSTNIVHTGQPNHYSGYVFTNTVMKAGNESMPSPTGGTETGHSGNGYCKITWHPAL